MTRCALISVSDRTGLVEFARGLTELQFTLLTTSGSGKALTDAKIASLSIEDYTGQKEILDGRVKTLHPKIHAGLLAKQDNPQHVRELQENDIFPIEVVAVNLYPFLEKVKSEAATDPAKMIEFIDIGGPTMIRAAAKNHASVLPVIDPTDYPAVLEFLKTGSALGKSGLHFRRYLASRVFTAIANYDVEIARYMSEVAENETYTPSKGVLTPIVGSVFEREQKLRYGENPHQQAAFYRRINAGPKQWEQLNGKELSYNNLLDVDAALRIISTFPSTQSVTAIIKHANPCGAAIGKNLLDSLTKAKQCDPRSHFGGILAFNTKVSKEAAENIREDFAEVVIAPAYEPDALTILQSSKNLRVLRIDSSALQLYETRSVLDGLLFQERDLKTSAVAELETVSDRKLTPAELLQLQFAWSLCSHVKSNAIVLVNDGMLVGAGAGQMSRVDSVELAIKKAQTHNHNLKGAVAASDAFFPFTDGIETLAAAGISAIVAPNGAKRDDEVIATANRLGVSLVFAPDRHFRH